MTTLTNKDGRTVTASSKGQEKGKALVTARSADGVVSSCMVTVDEARRHMASLYEQGWR